MKLIKGLGSPERQDDHMIDGTIVDPPPSILPTPVQLLTAVESRPSKQGPHSTLFRDFKLLAVPVYNFFVSDESTNDHDDVGQRLLGELPRYVKLSWSPAPLLGKQLAVTKMSRKPPHPGQVSGISKNGLTFNPTHLNDVTLAKMNSANGFVTSRVIDTVIEIVRQENDPISEEKFLVDGRTAGASFNELRSNAAVVGRLDGILTVDAEFSESPAVSLRMQAVGGPGPASDDKSIVASFVETNIVGVFDERRVNAATRPHHVEAIIGLATALTNVPSAKKVTQTIAPTFAAPISTECTEYIGYVLQKFVMSDSGTFILVAELDISDPTSTEYVDSKVLYGKMYRYRIRSVLRWTRSSSIGIAGKLKLGGGEDGSFVNTSALAPKLASYFMGAWCDGWAYTSVIDTVLPPPPDEINVRPDSRANVIYVSWKFPEDDQLDISGFKVMRKTIDATSHDDASDWSIVGLFPASNGQHVDRDVTSKQDNGGLAFAYCVQTLTKHGEESALSDQLAVSLTSDFRTTGEDDVVSISQAGVILGHHGNASRLPPNVASVKRTIDRSVIVTAHADSGQQHLDDVNYVIRFESLSTGALVDVKILVDYNDKSPIVQEIAAGPVKFTQQPRTPAFVGDSDGPARNVTTPKVARALGLPKDV